MTQPIECVYSQLIRKVQIANIKQATKDNSVQLLDVLAKKSCPIPTLSIEYNNHSSVDLEWIGQMYVQIIGDKVVGFRRGDKITTMREWILPQEAPTLVHFILESINRSAKL